MSSTPDDRRYTSDHEWAHRDGEIVRVGITAYAQDQLGDVVYVDLPSPGAEVDRGQVFGEVESTKSVSDLFAPVSGVIEERNEALESRPELINEDPYGQGWLVVIRPRDADEVDGLLSASEYDASTE